MGGALDSQKGPLESGEGAPCCANLLRPSRLVSARPLTPLRGRSHLSVARCTVSVWSLPADNETAGVLLRTAAQSFDFLYSIRYCPGPLLLRRWCGLLLRTRFRVAVAWALSIN